MINELKPWREAAGASQIRIAKMAGMPRMRLSLAQTGDVELKAEEIVAIRKAIATFAKSSADRLTKIAELAADGDEFAAKAAR
jgi:transcriptional regulator with XRE-family HTH domain